MCGNCQWKNGGKKTFRLERRKERKKKHKEASKEVEPPKAEG